MRIVRWCCIALWSVPLALLVSNASVFLGRIGPLTAALSWILTVSALSVVRWVVLVPSLRARKALVVPAAPSADFIVVAGSASAFGMMLAVCIIDSEHALALGIVTMFLAAIATLGVAVLAYQRRLGIAEIATPMLIVAFSAAATVVFAQGGRVPVGGSIIAPLISTLALLGWGGVYRRAWIQFREEVRAELRREPRRAHGSSTLVRIRRDGSDDPPSVA